MKFMIEHQFEVKEEWHRKIIEMYNKGLIDFAPSWITDEDGKIIIQEISVVMTEKFRIEREMEGVFNIVPGEDGNPSYARRKIK